MKHGANIKKLGRETDQRRALRRSLAKNLVEHGKIKTTEAKAKALRPFIEKLITMGKKGDLASRRLIISRLGGNSAQETATKICNDLAKRYTDRNGGYTRITKLPARPGDAAKLAFIELV
ncbi:MAG: 50S ribosomal protein L17 [Patescibacteria group bacterium]